MTDFTHKDENYFLILSPTYPYVDNEQPTTCRINVFKNDYISKPLYFNVALAHNEYL